MAVAVRTPSTTVVDDGLSSRTGDQAGQPELAGLQRVRTAPGCWPVASATASDHRGGADQLAEVGHGLELADAASPDEGTATTSSAPGRWARRGLASDRP